MADAFADEADGDQDNGSEPSFAELLESYDAALHTDLQVGDRVTVKIISVGTDTVFVDTGSKIDGTVDRQELCDDDGRLRHAVGDSLELFVIGVSESEIRLSRAISGIGGLEMLQDALNNQIPVEGRVTETCKGGFRVEILKRRAFCPVSQIDVTFVETPEAYVGQTYEFFVTRLSEGGRNIVVSRRKLLEQELKKVRKQFLSEIRSGDVVAGTVTRIMPYGAFVAVAQGVEGMVHISEMSWSRVNSAEDVVASGDAVKVRIIGIEKAENGRTKLALSMKQVQEDPWNGAAGKFAIGDNVSGKVTRCMDFGAFVEIAPGIEGLVHVSEMSYVKRVVKAEDVVSPGQSVAVVIKDVNVKDRRISLSLRDAEGDPWSLVAEKYSVGQQVEGVVQKHESFGIFVTLEPGVTGLLHKSRIGRASRPAAIERLRSGDPIPVVVEKIDAAARKITLNVGDAKEEGDWKQYTGDSRSAMGSLGAELQEAMARKNKG